MTGLTPPAGVDANPRPIDGCSLEWLIRGPERATYLGFRLWGSQEEKTNRVGRVVQQGRPAYVAIRTGVVSFGPDISDPDELRRFGWAVLQSCQRLAAALELGNTGPTPEPEPDPQTTLDALDVSPSGYSGAHYAVWPKELVRLLVDEMCPRRVCTTCGQPSRRITEAEPSPYTGLPGVKERRSNGRSKGPLGPGSTGIRHDAEGRRATTTGWSDCGHDTWRPGRILDPFVGSGTTLEVATGMGRDATGIDLDERNALLAAERVGMFLEVDQPTREAAS